LYIYVCLLFYIIAYVYSYDILLMACTFTHIYRLSYIISAIFIYFDIIERTIDIWILDY